jgi:hypothetical protein
MEENLRVWTRKVKEGLRTWWDLLVSSVVDMTQQTETRVLIQRINRTAGDPGDRRVGSPGGRSALAIFFWLSVPSDKLANYVDKIKTNS